VFANVNSYYSHYKADFGTGRTIDLDVYAVNVYAQQTFKVAKNDNTGSKRFLFFAHPYGRAHSRAQHIWSVDGGVQQTLLKGKSNSKSKCERIFFKHYAGVV
jgi:hypothetical protein